MEDENMKEIKAFEEAKATGANFKDSGINSTMYWAYERSNEAGNDTIDFSEVIWDYDIEPIVKACRAYGIDHITISSTFSGLITTLAEFEKHGCKMDGLTKVKTSYTDWQTGEKQILPAILVRI